ncbi:MAG: hypothetical protein ACTSWN_06140 [Promethearchaeota archaeon]
MMELLRALKDKERKNQVIEILAFLSLTAIVFYLSRNRVVFFGMFIYAGFIFIAWRTPARKISSLIGLVGGSIGFFTELWGCSNRYWNWTQPCVSIWMIGGNPYGFPFEVVFAYFSAGFWIGKVVQVMFPRLIDSQMNVNWRLMMRSLSFLIKLMIAVVIFTISLIIIIIEPAYLQSLMLLSCGLLILIFLERDVTGVVLLFAVVMGLAGFFFENFATGIIPGFSVWEYDIPLYSALKIPIPIIGVAPVTAFLAYFGCGLLLFSLSFMLPVKLRKKNRSLVKQ